MKTQSFRVCSIFLLAGALTATVAGTSCTAEDELEDLEDRSGYGDEHDDHHHDTCEVETRDIELWPPNHALVEIDVPEDCIEEVRHCGHDCEVKVLWVASDEAVDAPGSGNTAPDIVCVDDETVQVRRERSGQGDGRVYKIAFELECDDHHDHHYGDYEHDHDDHEDFAICEVSVPHDQGQGDEAVWSGQAYRVDC